MSNRHQNAEEVAWLLPKISGAKRILEVGSCFGGMLRSMASVAEPGAIIRSVDLPSDSGISGKVLQETCEELRARGFDAECLIANSHDSTSVEWAKQWAPYDFVFIDGDHSREGCMQDYQNYACMSKMVGFHDIMLKGGRDFDCGVAWDQISAIHQWEAKVVSPPQMGIGVIYK